MSYGKEVWPLPRRIERPCCPGKTCGNTSFYLVATHDYITGRDDWGYRRDSNGDWYVWFESKAELAAWLREPY